MTEAVPSPGVGGSGVPQAADSDPYHRADDRSKLGGDQVGTIGCSAGPGDTTVCARMRRTGILVGSTYRNANHAITLSGTPINLC